jgi:hypothetical protein
VVSGLKVMGGPCSAKETHWATSSEEILIGSIVIADGFLSHGRLPSQLLNMPICEHSDQAIETFFIAVRDSVRVFFRESLNFFIYLRLHGTMRVASSAKIP